VWLTLLAFPHQRHLPRPIRLHTASIQKKGIDNPLMAQPPEIKSTLSTSSFVGQDSLVDKALDYRPKGSILASTLAKIVPSIHGIFHGIPWNSMVFSIEFHDIFHKH
jgi:hypothetical protein